MNLVNTVCMKQIRVGTEQLTCFPYNHCPVRDNQTHEISQLDISHTTVLGTFLRRKHTHTQQDWFDLCSPLFAS